MTDINSITAEQISERLQSAGFKVNNHVIVGQGGTMTMTHVSIHVFGIISLIDEVVIRTIFAGEKVKISCDSNNETISIHPIL